MNRFATCLGVLAMLFVTGSPAAPGRLLTEVDIKPGEKATALVVLLHGYTLDGDSLTKVQKALGRIDDLKGADILRPNLPLDTFSMATSSQITAELILAIDRAWEKRAASGNPYKRIVMVGHSIGGLYARKVYVAACGENAEAVIEKSLKDNLALLQTTSPENVRPWASAVDRIVLLAGMNRGWSISHHMSIPRAVSMKMGVGVGYVLKWLYGRPPIIFTVRRGSPFITQLRLQWLAMREHAKVIKDKSVGDAVTVQLLGTIDDLVSPDDNIDLISGKDFVYLDVPESGHLSVIDMGNTDKGIKRQEVLIQAFSSAVLDSAEVLHPGDASLTVRRDVTDVVFVIHGIRDEGYWTQKIARRVQRLGILHDRRRIIAAETSSYGYFPILSFLQPGARQEKVEWLMDRYTEARATYPKANFHYVGHSHGTYLLTKALQDYPSVRFDQVVFAGSVVQRDYQWQKYVPDRIKSVINFVATADWVVAFFPKSLQSVGIQDLGSAGHDGFEAAKTQSRVIEPDTYIVGGHGAALQEAMWDSIAEYTVTGSFIAPPAALRSPEQSKWVVYPAKVGPLIWVGIIGLLTWVLYLLAKLQIREWKKTVVIMSYIAVIFTVLTEV